MQYTPLRVSLFLVLRSFIHIVTGSLIRLETDSGEDEEDGSVFSSLNRSIYLGPASTSR